MSNSSNREVLERLDQILRVLALQVGPEKSITERVYLLNLAGLDNNTIAKVLNTSPATVRTLRSDIRRGIGRTRSTRTRSGKKRPDNRRSAGSETMRRGRG